MMPPNRFCSWFPCAAPLRFNLLGNVLIKDLAQLFRGVRGIQVPPEALDEILSLSITLGHTDAVQSWHQVSACPLERGPVLLLRRGAWYENTGVGRGQYRASSGVLRHTKESIDHARRHRLSLLRLRSHVNKQGLDLGKFSTSLLVKLLHLGGQLGDDLLSNFHPVDVLGQHSLIVVNAVTLVNRRNHSVDELIEGACGGLLLGSGCLHVILADLQDLHNDLWGHRLSSNCK
mmetsp:Transcript_23264/g.36394  ORF Transcript_23264/g.36394 Transcript_23264/m.36394 type:complete len:232 (-) Transcript_23264:408-1103(-)